MDITTVLTSPNPYRSRALTVETDRESSVAYLRDARGAVRGAVWLANHCPAPATADPGRADGGLPPVLPMHATGRPAGTPPLDPAALSVLWFEEGDGVALFENGELLAVIPSWADMDRGMPGYARDAVGESPYAWPLAEAMEGLSSRVAQARAYWRWREARGSWASFQQFVMGHLDGRVGPPGRYWNVGGGSLPVIGVTERPATAERDHTILSTVGMSCQRMPGAELYDTACRVELAVATRQDPRAVARLFAWLGRYPWRSVTWLGDGHTARWFRRPDSFPLDGDYQGVIMLVDPPGFPDMSGFAVGGDPVRWLWLFPLTEAELRLTAEHGHEVPAERLAVRHRI
ncbi:suppressor of fused domain protein [Sphaerimonospora cavernae]|uniref:Suppressor of fused domain protein n=1 Tax=Sphaerimonospora cavernae TaxID=1740611 RepID=A0ABV6UD83_9ACTN